MFIIPIATLVLIAPTHALIRFGCSQLVVDRLDPLVEPGNAPSAHLHQIIGGNSFVPDMRPGVLDPAKTSTCTTCQPADDFSNYWTAPIYFKARNGTYKRVPQKGNSGFEGQNGGMTVYYMQNQLADFQQASKVTAFKPGFRMIIGSPTADTRAQADKFPQLTYTCLQDMSTRFPETKFFPKKPCPAGIMINLRFPTCWDGVNLDSPDHMAHMSYPASGTFESQGPCPASHPVRMPQVMFEVIYETKDFNDPALWPEDGGQPFAYSFGDQTGYANHGDYLFGWKDDSLQKIMDEECFVNCKSMKTQSIQQMNACSTTRKVVEDIGDANWLTSLPGQHHVE
ncbi:hypothetical protein HBH56_169700 [Parastagonospora nodorum]|uniref:DUF1996 domain-containing protein n=1 Tax=Phaeosphaeria nodorum (strain SN15 / ATCC MYA-4574 / FGSC 10173) TaxID=321614 RepID=A0A7U2EX06_PHANO|nr:hypothetical protein HBH56_169700 [Parastagonospora nodorum]QRC94386.1 hypothetical protein JI435_076280 [Parastagonospora nodorum SN15]KAH3928534.1 hypothetical protein HBH54_138250 [Parastagonospora nodorum]KAH3945308.1 hypothetical protein HBH53_143600 [Parastagonospora nodorum]KAH4037943.1 hypothetical protein HBI09_060930 [Parastagonospora nodorum]